MLCLQHQLRHSTVNYTTASLPCNINYITLLRTTLLQVYHATSCYMNTSGYYIVLWCTEPKLPSSILRGDVYQATTAIETIEHYGTYLFLLMEAVDGFLYSLSRWYNLPM